MAMKAQQRWLLIGGALVLTLSAMYLLREPVDESEQQNGVNHHSKLAPLDTQNKSFIKTMESLPDLTRPDLTGRGDFDDNTSQTNVDLFKVHTWTIAPRPSKKVLLEAVKPILTAPPIPFIYMGKLENTPQGTQIFLSAQNKVLTIMVGNNVEGVWRLDKEDANTLFFTYLPLGLPKVLFKATKAVIANNVNAASNADASTNDNQNQDH